ncbi:MAG: DNA oxidative demethylase AlkB [Gammaproteobacteria bacterium]
MMDLFDDPPPPRERLGAGAMLLRGFAAPVSQALMAAIEAVLADAPPRCMVTPGGRRMSVAMTNCGTLGWISETSGYRYSREDPASGRPWPALPPVLLRLSGEAAAEAGFAGFVPDACLVNLYTPGTRLSLHQDRNERDFSAPIVSVSLGLPAVFLWGGARRADRTRRIPLLHGDVLVWGGPDRLRHHGVAPLKPAQAEPAVRRINLTLRKAG